MWLVIIPQATYPESPISYQRLDRMADTEQRELAVEIQERASQLGEGFIQGLVIGKTILDRLDAARGTTEQLAANDFREQQREDSRHGGIAVITTDNTEAVITPQEYLKWRTGQEPAFCSAVRTLGIGKVNAYSEQLYAGAASVLRLHDQALQRSTNGR
jgi:hypothetical protein